MKVTHSFILAALASGVLSAASIAKASENLIEIPIQNVFVPKSGFDDNDHVEVVVRSSLPNSCYTAGVNTLEIKPDKKQIKVRHLAFRETNGPCAAPDDQLPVGNLPFLAPAVVGQLDQGDYTVEFGGVKARPFQVEKAKVDYVDNFHYTSVSAIETAEIFSSKEDVKVVLSGLFGNSCEQFAESPTVKLVDDVIIILPIMAPIDPTVTCLRYLREYKEEVKVGTLPVGEYLVHSRSREGRAVYRLINVQDQN